MAVRNDYIDDIFKAYEFLGEVGFSESISQLGEKLKAIDKEDDKLEILANEIEEMRDYLNRLICLCEMFQKIPNNVSASIKFEISNREVGG